MNAAMSHGRHPQWLWRSAIMTPYTDGMTYLLTYSLTKADAANMGSVAMLPSHLFKILAMYAARKLDPPTGSKLTLFLPGTVKTLDSAYSQGDITIGR